MMVIGILTAAALLLPPAAIVGVVLWSRRLSREPAIPPVATRGALMLAGAAAVSVAGGIVFGLVAALPISGGSTDDVSPRARALGRGISYAMNGEVIAFGIALFAIGWLIYWKSQQRSSPSDEA